MAIVGKTPRKGSNAHFVKSGQGGKGVKVSPGKGGVSTGTPTGCESKRAHRNLRTGY